MHQFLIYRVIVALNEKKKLKKYLLIQLKTKYTSNSLTCSLYFSSLIFMKSIFFSTPSNSTLDSPISDSKFEFSLKSKQIDLNFNLKSL